MAGAKITVRKYGRGMERVIEILQREIRTQRFLDWIAVFARDRIYKNTKRGYYPGVQRVLSKLKPLSPGYIQFRKNLLKRKIGRVKGVGNTPKEIKKYKRDRALMSFGDNFSPAKSNLTMTGQMLDALEANVVAGKIVITVEATPRRDSEEGLTNKDVAKKVINEGRPFLGLDSKGVDRIRKQAIADLRRSLKKR